MGNYIKRPMRHYFHLISFLFLMFLVFLAGGCGGGGGDSSWDFIDTFVPSITQFKSTPVWETWEMAVLLLGDDDKDYSFTASLVITRNGNEICGFGNANGSSPGSFLVTGTRTGDSIEFEIQSQNRYRAFSLIGKGIYVNADTEIGGNSIEGEDFLTIFDDPVQYSGNFQVQVKPLSQPASEGTFEGHLNSSYNSIENGEIVLQTSPDGTLLAIVSIKGNLVGSEQTEGVFAIDDPSLFGNVEIAMNKFTAVAINGNDTIEISGAISDDIASGVVIYQKEGRVYIGAFSALLK